MDPHPFHGLANFPYRTVDDLQAVRRQGIASLDVQPQQATSWAMGQGGARGAAVALGIAAWIWVPILVLVAAFVTGSAWATAAIPIAILYYNLGYPAGTRPRRGPSVAIPLAIAVFLSAARSESIALAVISSAALNSLGEQSGRNQDCVPRISRLSSCESTGIGDSMVAKRDPDSNR